MSRIRSRIFWIFWIVGIALISLAWLRSNRFVESIELIGPRSGLLVSGHPGRLCICWPSPVAHPAGRRWSIRIESTPISDGIPSSEQLPFNPAFSPSAWTRPPRFVAKASTINGVKTQYIEIPDRALLTIALLPLVSALSISAWRNLRGRRRGLCRNCGYDLRASRDICPECGTTSTPTPTRRRWPKRIGQLLAIALLVIAIRRLSSANCNSASYIPIDQSTLGGFSFNEQHDTINDIPFPLRQLDGQRVEVQGYMIPSDQPGEFEEFRLVPIPPTDYDIGFTPLSIWQQTIFVRTPSGKPVKCDPRHLQIRGTLHVRLLCEDGGYIFYIYEMTMDSATSVTGNADNFHSR